MIKKISVFCLMFIFVFSLNDRIFALEDTELKNEDEKIIKVTVADYHKLMQDLGEKYDVEVTRTESGASPNTVLSEFTEEEYKDFVKEKEAFFKGVYDAVKESEEEVARVEARFLERHGVSFDSPLEHKCAQDCSQETMFEESTEKFNQSEEKIIGERPFLQEVYESYAHKKESVERWFEIEGVIKSPPHYPRVWRFDKVTYAEAKHHAKI